MASLCDIVLHSGIVRFRFSSSNFAFAHARRAQTPSTSHRNWQAPLSWTVVVAVPRRQPPSHAPAARARSRRAATLPRERRSSPSVVRLRACTHISACRVGQVGLQCHSCVACVMVGRPPFTAQTTGPMTHSSASALTPTRWSYPRTSSSVPRGLPCGANSR